LATHGRLDANVNAIITSFHVVPIVAKSCMNFEFWLSNLIDVDFILLLKAEV